MSSPKFPEPPAAIPPTPLAEVDKKLARLSEHKAAWLAVGLPARAAYLERCMRGVVEVADAWVADLCKMKGIEPGANLAGEEWLAGPATTVRNIRLLREALLAGGQKKPPSLRARPSGQLVAQVLPDGVRDKLMFSGTTAEIWIEPGKPASQGRVYRDPKGAAKLCAVLGAGNVASIPPMDVLYKLFAEDEVVILKMNPVNEVVGPHLEKALGCLIDDGFLEIVYGGAAVGAHLTNHALVDTLHVTGSNRTYDAIVWGSDPAEQARRKAANDPLNRRPFTAELGAVTPILVVPGQWSDKAIKFQARHIAGMVAQNASFNCNAGKVLVTAKGWPQREQFLAEVGRVLAATAPRKAYYPGAQQRYQAFLEHYPQAKPVGQAGPEIVPWTVIPDVPANAEEYALSNEAFCGVLAQVALEATSAEEFLKAGVSFANDKCFGTLSCSVIIDDATQKRCATELDAAIEALRYGGIAINSWPGMLYAFCSTTWGAFPGHPQSDISSGAGVVHNTFLFDYPQKSVVRAPFLPPMTPAYFADHGALRALGKALVEMEAAPGPGALFRLASAGMRG
jgi:acyl-CoA reductase-like NAD-dependent aldehyde dehydrogenase